MPTHAQLLDRWHQQLTKLAGDASANATWRNRLRAKVLQYLIDRYEDPRRWNQHAGRRRQGRGDLGTRGEGSVAGVLRQGRRSPWRPRTATQLPVPLDRIHAGNLESYAEYGMRT